MPYSLIYNFQHNKVSLMLVQLEKTFVSAICFLFCLIIIISMYEELTQCL